jgi:glycyl-tRNA synthetase
MEIEYFVPPDSAEEWFAYWVQQRYDWYLRYGMQADKLRLRQHDSDELAHYAKGCYDVEYLFPMGWSELEGIAHRGDYDLQAHAAASGRNLTYFDDKTRQHYPPYVIEPSAGADRATLAFLIDAYRDEEVRGRQRVVLRLHPALAPIKVAILPLLRNRAEVVEIARKLHADLRRHFPADYNDTGAIGRLYARQDEVGTPYCVTVDVQTLADQQVTIRDRDTTAQERLALDQVRTYIQDRLVVD